MKNINEVIQVILRGIRFEIYEKRCLNPYWFQIESETNWNNGGIYQTKNSLITSLKGKRNEKHKK